MVDDRYIRGPAVRTPLLSIQETDSKGHYGEDAYRQYGTEDHVPTHSDPGYSGLHGEIHNRQGAPSTRSNADRQQARGTVLDQRQAIRNVADHKHQLHIHNVADSS